MGQAKNRGSRDERIVQATALRRALTTFTGYASAFGTEGGKSDDVLANWLDRAKTIAHGASRGDALYAVFEPVLNFVWREQYAGGCHYTSAILYILMSEKGLSPTLNLGEVSPRARIFFDHSWVECDGLVFDAAVCLPQSGGAYAGGPVFASVDLETNATTDLRFGVPSGYGLDKDGQLVLDSDLATYAKCPAMVDVWSRAVTFGNGLGLELTVAGLIDKYGSVKRTHRVAEEAA